MNEKETIKQVLRSFGISTEDINATSGSTVTLYTFRPQIGTRISRIRNLKDEIAVALSVPSVRVIAPMMDGSIGIEVPNRQRDIIPVSDILSSNEYSNNNMELPCALGRTMTGGIFMADLAQMPHLLIAGATGQGKSVGLNVLLLSLMAKRTPDEMRLILIDPKQVELSIYSELVHSYLASPVITDVQTAYQTLSLLCVLMDERYSRLNEEHVRNITEYNAKNSKRMPYIVVVIDEYGDLVMQAGKQMEYAICRLAQKARAVGIHVIISTQRPSVTIVTGDIKANFPTRIAFRTTTGTDSRVILDQTGAEKLLGKGDMIYYNGADLTRVQCAFASTDEVELAVRNAKDKYQWEQYEDILPDPKILLPPSIPEGEECELYKRAILAALDLKFVIPDKLMQKMPYIDKAMCEMLLCNMMDCHIIDTNACNLTVVSNLEVGLRSLQDYRPFKDKTFFKFERLIQQESLRLFGK